MYTNWDEKVKWIHPYRWTSITALVIYLQQLRRFIIFTPDKLMEQYLPTLDEITGPVPCKKNQRYPDGTIYTAELSIWQDDLDLLQLAVNVMFNKNKLLRKYPIFLKAGEVEIYAIRKINKILALINDAHEKMIVRETFEEYYGLVWEDATGDETFVPPAPITKPLFISSKKKFAPRTSSQKTFAPSTSKKPTLAKSSKVTFDLSTINMPTFASVTSTTFAPSTNTTSSSKPAFAPSTNTTSDPGTSSKPTFHPSSSSKPAFAPSTNTTSDPSTSSKPTFHPSTIDDID